MLKKSIVAFFIAMLPLIELRGALPYALASGIPTLPAYIICIVGNMLPVPFIYFFATSVLNWGKTKPVIGLQSSAGVGLYVALMLFVGIPLPGTGAWTGTFAASILHMDFKKSVLAVVAGVLLAGIIMGVLTFMGIQILT